MSRWGRFSCDMANWGQVQINHFCPFWDTSIEQKLQSHKNYVKYS